MRCAITNAIWQTYKTPKKPTSLNAAIWPEPTGSPRRMGSDQI
jgi:hypothetical protein